jgi:hypothetical protein
MRTDQELVESIRNTNSSDDLIELSNRHSGLLMQMVQPYMPNLLKMDSGFFTHFDTYKTSITYDAVKTYDPNKGQFNTWLGQQARYFGLNSRKKIFETEEIHEADMFYEPERKLNTEKAYEVLADYDETVHKVFELRYEDNKTWKEIGDEIGKCYERARQIHEKGLKYLRNHLKKEDLLPTIS